MTIPIDEDHIVSISHGQKVGPKRYVASGKIYRKDSVNLLKEVSGEGTTMTSADSDCEREARHWLASNG